jgi:DNA modification methylase
MEKIELFDENGNSRGFYSTANILNDLTGKEWVYWTKSVIDKPYPPNLSHKLRNQHGGQKPPDLCADLIKIFTKTGQVVLDPLMGVGGTLLGASLSGRRAIGIELEKRWIEIYKEVCQRENLAVQTTYQGDCRRIIPQLASGSIDFVLTDVPYWAMDKLPKSKGVYKKVGEKAKPKIKTELKQFNNRPMQTKEQWLGEMKEIFTYLWHPLKNGKYMAVFVGDLYNRREYHFLSAELGMMLKSLGYTMKANLIWHDPAKTLHDYGYQYTYIPSIIHQSVLIFQKPL